MSLYPIAEKQTYTAVRLGLFGWRELKADAELRVYNYYKPQAPSIGYRLSRSRPTVSDIR